MVPSEGFHISAYLVRNAEYEAMIPSHRQDRDELRPDGNQPCVNVTWWEAQLFCEWRNSRCRLATSEEWNRAAHWNPTTERFQKFPWGNEVKKKLVKSWDGGTFHVSEVWDVPLDLSPCGCGGMGGPTFEWTSEVTHDDRIVIRGGKIDLSATLADHPRDFLAAPDFRSHVIGFRCLLLPGLCTAPESAPAV
jgi:formylglycine-generating enzyme required for sulfatase activity